MQGVLCCAQLGIISLHMTQVYTAIECKTDDQISWHMLRSMLRSPSCLVSVGEVSAQPDMIDLTDAIAAQQLEQATGHTASKQHDALAEQPSVHDRERGRNHDATAVIPNKAADSPSKAAVSPSKAAVSPSKAAVTPSKASVSREHNSAAVSPISPAISSGRKHKQADIRGFLSPKSQQS